LLAAIFVGIAASVGVAALGLIPRAAISGRIRPVAVTDIGAITCTGTVALTCCRTVTIAGTGTVAGRIEHLLPLLAAKVLPH
jgi:hypothetical protein